MRTLLLLLLLGSLVMAFSVKPDYIEIKDTGNPGLAKMNVGIAIDCEDRSLAIDVTDNSTGEPVENARTDLFYTQYAYQLISTGKTDSNGEETLAVVGNLNYLTALFILHAENPQHMTKEIEFTYEKCFEQPPPEETQPPQPPEQNVTPPPPQPPENQTPPPPANQTQPSQPPGGNVTPPEPAASPQAPCLTAFVLLLSLVFFAKK